MKATLSFTLPEETAEHRAAVQGGEAKRVLWEIDQRCRAVVKYGQYSDETIELAETIRGMIRESPENLLED